MLLVQSVSLRRVIGSVGGQSSVSLSHVIGSVSESRTCYWFSQRVSDVLLVQSESLRRVIGSVSESQTCYWFSQ